MFYSEILRLAAQDPKIGPAPTKYPIPTPAPATTNPAHCGTGMVVTGNFETFRHPDGYMVIIGENGQYIRK